MIELTERGWQFKKSGFCRYTSNGDTEWLELPTLEKIILAYSQQNTQV